MLIIHSKDVHPTDINIRKLQKPSNDLHKANKWTKNVRINLEDVFRFMKHNDKINFDIIFPLSLTKADPNQSIYRLAAVTKAKVSIEDINWWVRYEAPFQHNIIFVNEYILPKNSTDISSFSKSVSQKQFFVGSIWTSEIGVQEGKKSFPSTS